jgi:hypothetical protein
MKRFARGFLVSAVLLATGVAAPGALEQYAWAPGLVYDSDLDITWLKDAAGTGHLSWDGALAWADAFAFDSGGVTYTDWRLPATDLIQGGVHREWGYLNTAYGIDSDNPGPFTGLFDSDYWTSEEWDADHAITFTLSSAFLGQYYNPPAQPANSQPVSHSAWYKHREGGRSA